MDLSADQSATDGNRRRSLSTVLSATTVWKIGRQLVKFFTLSENDRLSAGINLGREEHDR